MVSPLQTKNKETRYLFRPPPKGTIVSAPSEGIFILLEAKFFHHFGNSVLVIIRFEGGFVGVGGGGGGARIGGVGFCAMVHFMVIGRYLF